MICHQQLLVELPSNHPFHEPVYLFESKLLYIENHFDGALSVITKMNNIGTWSPTPLKTFILVKLRRFDEARECLPSDEVCKINLLYKLVYFANFV